MQAYAQDKGKGSLILRGKKNQDSMAISEESNF